MIRSKLLKFDTLVVGIILGIIIPVIVYFLTYSSKLSDVSETIFSHNEMIGSIIPIIISHCVLPNLLVFLIFNGLNMMHAAKGVLGTTVVLTVILFGIKLIFSLL